MQQRYADTVPGKHCAPGFRRLRRVRKLRENVGTERVKPPVNEFLSVMTIPKGARLIGNRRREIIHQR